MTGMTMAQKASILKDPNVWNADTGATSNSTFNDEGMYNVRQSESNITMGKGESVCPSKLGDIKVEVHNKCGEELYDATMQQVAHVPGANFNLFSLTMRMKKRWKLGGDSEKIWLEKNNKRIVFDIVIPIPKGDIYCAYLCRKGSEVAAASKSQKNMNVNLAHELLGHGDSTRETAKALGVEITRGTMKPCKACADAKAK